MDSDEVDILAHLHGPALEALFAEIGLGAKVRGPGVGIDPTWATAITVISVPFSIFFARFLDRAATDAYDALKIWLSRLAAAANPARVELRDSADRTRTFLFPNEPTEKDYRQLLPGLARATIWRGRDLEQRRDTRSLDQAEQWYERAFSMEGAPPSTRCEAACRLL